MAQTTEAQLDQFIVYIAGSIYLKESLMQRYFCKFKSQDHIHT